MCRIFQGRLLSRPMATMDRFFKRYFSAAASGSSPLEAGGWSSSGGGTSGRRPRGGERRWGLLQPPASIRKQPHVKRLFLGESSEKPQGTGALPERVQQRGQIQTDDRFSTDADRGTSGRGKPRSGRTSASGGRLRAGGGPIKCGLACRRNGRRVHRQFQVPEDLPDDAALRDRRDDAQRALLTHGTACHVHGKDPLQQPRPVPLEM